MSEVYVCQLPADVQKYAADVLHETEDSRRNGFKEIQKWAEENQHLNIRMEEKYILPFLRGCKFDLGRTQEKMRNFYTMRRDRPEWFRNRNPLLPQIKELVKMGCFLVLRKTHENHLVVIVRATVHDPKIYSLDDILKTGKMMMDIAVMEMELTQIYGVIVIIDLNNASFGHAKQLTVSRVKNMVYAWQNYHCKPKKMEFVNAPTYVNIALNVFKSFMTQKLRDRVHVSYEGNSSLTNIVGKAILPQDYGGDGETMEELGDYWIEKLTSYAQWFVEDEQYIAQ